jgi:hypothetical protein
MDNTGIIAAALVIGFIVFITTRGELPAYLKVIGLA